MCAYASYHVWVYLAIFSQKTHQDHCHLGAADAAGYQGIGGHPGGQSCGNRPTHGILGACADLGNHSGGFIKYFAEYCFGKPLSLTSRLYREFLLFEFSILQSINTVHSLQILIMVCYHDNGFLKCLIDQYVV